MPMTINTVLREIKGKGIGLITDEMIKAGDIIYKDDPEFDKIIPAAQVLKMSPALQNFMSTYASFNKKTDSYYLCCDNARFFNHSENPNTKYNKDNGTVTALRDIAKGEELLSDYREFDDFSKDGDFGFEILK